MPKKKKKRRRDDVDERCDEHKGKFKSRPGAFRRKKSFSRDIFLISLNEIEEEISLFALCNLILSLYIGKHQRATSCVIEIQPGICFALN